MRSRGATKERTAAGPTEAGRRVLELSDVYLLTAASAGQDAVPGLRVVLDGVGLTVCKPDGDEAAAVRWDDMSRLETRARMRTPAGEQGVLVEAEAEPRTHRFLVPTADPEGLEREVGELAQALLAPPKRGRRGLLRRFVLGVALVTIAAEIALIVLLTTGSVKI
jgi:hypothetical protein